MDTYQLVLIGIGAVALVGLALVIHEHLGRLKTRRLLRRWRVI